VLGGVVLLLAFFALVEVLSRVLFPEVPPIRFQQDVQVLMGTGEERFAQVLEADDDLFWRLRPDVVLPVQGGRYGGRVSNSQRLREDHEIRVPKPPGEKRVLFVGSSPTFGTGVLLDQCFVEVAERLLNADLQGGHVECINAGVPGYSLFQGMRFLESEGFRYEPDLVVLQFGASGIQVWDDRGDPQYHDDLARRRPPGLLASSRACRLLWEKLRSRPGDGTKRPRLLPTEFRRLLVDAKQETRRHGAGLMFVVWPSRTHVMRTQGERHTPLHEIMLSFAANQGIPAVDMLPLFSRLCHEHPVNEVFLDQWHVTALTNAEVGRTLADAIERWMRGP